MHTTISWGSTGANGYGWNNADVSLSYTTADDRSGVDTSVPGSPLLFTSEGAGQTQNVTVTDVAGNSQVYTSPEVKTHSNCPYFKTERLLGGRALVCDTFRKPRNRPQNEPGDGQKIHGTGYNALYGDMHVAWCGDPTGEIAYWPMSTDRTINLAQSGYSGDYLGADDPLTILSRTMGVLVWHLFDERGGVDVGTEPGS